MSIKRSFQRACPVSTPLLEIRVFPHWSHSLFAFNTQATLAPWPPIPAYLTGVFGASITSGSSSSWRMWSNIYIIILFACENKGLLKAKALLWSLLLLTGISTLVWTQGSEWGSNFKQASLCSLTYSQGVWKRELGKEQPVLVMALKHLGWQEWKLSGKSCAGKS